MDDNINTPMPAEERSSKAVINMPVLSISEGQPLGTVRQILIDPAGRRVQGFLVERRRFSRDERVLPFAAVSGFGQDTLTVAKQTLLERKGQSYQFVRALRHPLPLIGSRVFTAGGRILGKVEEYRFRVSDGAISGLEIAGDGFFKTRTLVKGEYVIALAAHTVMLKDEAVEEAIELENAFLNNMETAAGTVREAAATLKDNAVEAGKKLAGNFNEAVDKWRGSEPAVESRQSGVESLPEEETPEPEAEPEAEALPQPPQSEAAGDEPQPDKKDDEKDEEKEHFFAD